MSEKTILIVDDEKGPRESLRMILSAEYRVVTSDNGVDALEIMRSTRVDLVTVDLNMPGMKGAELMRCIRDDFPHTEMVVITGCGSIESAVEGIRFGVFDYLSKPFDVVQVTAAVGRALNRQQSRQNLVGFLEGIGSVFGRDREADEVVRELGHCQSSRDRLRSLIDAPALDDRPDRTRVHARESIEFLEVLAEAIEGRDQHSRGHARRVAFYAGLAAERMCLEPEEREFVRISGFLHDLGKVGVPTDIVTSQEDLGPAERARIEEHSAIGERLVKPLGFSSRVSSAIRHHHEHWDGGGYPDGLMAADIPLAARIVAVADGFDLMTSDRPYSPSMSVDRAIRELRKNAGSQFDPHVVEEFVAVIESGAADALECVADHNETVAAGGANPDRTTMTEGTRA